MKCQTDVSTTASGGTPATARRTIATRRSRREQRKENARKDAQAKLQEGTKVTVCDLMDAPELNGQMGTVTGETKVDEKYPGITRAAIFFGEASGTKLLPLQNIRLHPLERIKRLIELRKGKLKRPFSFFQPGININMPDKELLETILELLGDRFQRGLTLCPLSLHEVDEPLLTYSGGELQVYESNKLLEALTRNRLDPLTRKETAYLFFLPSPVEEIKDISDWNREGLWQFLKRLAPAGLHSVESITVLDRNGAKRHVKKRSPWSTSVSGMEFPLRMTMARRPLGLELQQIEISRSDHWSEDNTRLQEFNFMIMEAQRRQKMHRAYLAQNGDALQRQSRKVSLPPWTTNVDGSEFPLTLVVELVADPSSKPIYFERPSRPPVQSRGDQSKLDFNCMVVPDNVDSIENELRRGRSTVRKLTFTRQWALGMMQELAPAISQLTNLEELIIEHGDLGLSGAQGLATILDVQTRLTRLSLRNSDIYADGLIALVVSIGKLTMLQTLDLSRNRLGSQAQPMDAAMDGLTLALGNLLELQNLYLQWNWVSDDHVEMLAQQFRAPLRFVDLRDNRGADQDRRARAIVTGRGIQNCVVEV